MGNTNEVDKIRNQYVDNINLSINTMWLKGGLIDVRKVCTNLRHKNKWLDIIWKGRLVEINSKGKIRVKRSKETK